MNLLLDTHLLLWAAAEPQRLSAPARELIESADNKLHFSAASLWEIAIKNALQRPDFHVDQHLLRRGLNENGYLELPITAQRVLAAGHSSLSAIYPRFRTAGITVSSMCRA